MTCWGKSEERKLQPLEKGHKSVNTWEKAGKFQARHFQVFWNEIINKSEQRTHSHSYSFIDQE